MKKEVDAKRGGKTNMRVDSKEKVFDCIKDFECLGNGHRRQGVIIGDQTDARVAKFLFKTFVEHNWPSQWHTKYVSGYIRFSNGKIFDLANRTVEGRPAYIFLANDITNCFWRKQIAKKTIHDWIDRASDDDLAALAQLVAESTDLKLPWPCRSLAQELVQHGLEVLGVIQLEEFAALLTASSDHENSGLPRKVA